MVSVVDSERSSPVLRPKSSSAIADASLLLTGQNIGTYAKCLEIFSCFLRFGIGFGFVQTSLGTFILGKKLT